MCTAAVRTPSLRPPEIVSRVRQLVTDEGTSKSATADSGSSMDRETRCSEGLTAVVHTTTTAVGHMASPLYFSIDGSGYMSKGRISLRKQATNDGAGRQTLWTRTVCLIPGVLIFSIQATTQGFGRSRCITSAERHSDMYTA